VGKDRGSSNATKGKAGPMVRPRIENLVAGVRFELTTFGL